MNSSKFFSIIKERFDGGKISFELKLAAAREKKRFYRRQFVHISEKGKFLMCSKINLFDEWFRDFICREIIPFIELFYKIWEHENPSAYRVTLMSFLSLTILNYLFAPLWLINFCEHHGILLTHVNRNRKAMKRFIDSWEHMQVEGKTPYHFFSSNSKEDEKYKTALLNWNDCVQANLRELPDDILEKVYKCNLINVCSQIYREIINNSIDEKLVEYMYLLIYSSISQINRDFTICIRDNDFDNLRLKQEKDLHIFEEIACKLHEVAKSRKKLLPTFPKN
jgi:hypothetical protein